MAFVFTAKNYGVFKVFGHPSVWGPGLQAGNMKTFVQCTQYHLYVHQEFFTFSRKTIIMTISQKNYSLDNFCPRGGATWGRSRLLLYPGKLSKQSIPAFYYRACNWFFSRKSSRLSFWGKTQFFCYRKNEKMEVATPIAVAWRVLK